MLALKGSIVVPPLLPSLLKNFFIPRRSVKLSLDPLLGYQREDSLYFLNRQRNSHFLVVKRKVCSFKTVAFDPSLADLNLAGLLCLVPQVQWCRQWRFPPANQWSAVYTSRLVMVWFAWNLGLGGAKKSTRYCTQWKTPQKWAVLNRTMQWKSAIRHFHCSVLTTFLVWYCGFTYLWVRNEVWWVRTSIFLSDLPNAVFSQQSPANKPNYTFKLNHKRKLSIC